jgi:repressor LexA
MQTRTKRQKEVLEYITLYIESHGYEPSYQQIARHFGVKSKAGIAKHISALETQGLLTRRRENGSFSLELRPNKTISEVTHEILWLDLQATDLPPDDLEEESLFIPYFLLGYTSPEKIRAFRVRDDSMRDEQICEGDIALIERKTFARDGDCVVGLVGKKKVVLKKFYRDGADIELRSATDGFETVRSSADNVEVLGIFRGLLRPMN